MSDLSNELKTCSTVEQDQETAQRELDELLKLWADPSPEAEAQMIELLSVKTEKEAA